MRTKVRNPFKKLRLMLREIDNYFFYIRQVELFNDSGEMATYKLRLNNKHEMYGAINLQPELLLRTVEAELEQVEKTIFGAEVTKLNDVFVKYDIMELYKIQYDRIKDDDYYAYAYSISYMWKHCNKATILATLITTLTLLAAVTVGILYLVL